MQWECDEGAGVGEASRPCRTQVACTHADDFILRGCFCLRLACAKEMARWSSACPTYLPRAAQPTLYIFPGHLACMLVPTFSAMELWQGVPYHSRLIHRSTLKEVSGSFGLDILTSGSAACITCTPLQAPKQHTEEVNPCSLLVKSGAVSI